MRLDHVVDLAIVDVQVDKVSSKWGVVGGVFPDMADVGGRVEGVGFAEATV